MPANSNDLANRYLILTEALLSAAQAAEETDFQDLFDAREKILSELQEVSMTSEMASAFRRAMELEQEFQALSERELSHLKTQLIGHHQEVLGMKTYGRGPARSNDGPSVAC